MFRVFQFGLEQWKWLSYVKAPVCANIVLVVCETRSFRVWVLATRFRNMWALMEWWYDVLKVVWRWVLSLDDVLGWQCECVAEWRLIKRINTIGYMLWRRKRSVSNWTFDHKALLREVVCFVWACCVWVDCVSGLYGNGLCVRMWGVVVHSVRCAHDVYWVCVWCMLCTCGCV